jgi:VanZ family protein
MPTTTTAAQTYLPAPLVRKLPWLAQPTLWWIGFALWIATVFTLSSISGPDLPEGPKIPHLDKIVHATLYAAGAFTLANALRLAFPRRRLLLAGAIAVAAIGALDEFYQLHTPGRSGADFYDWLADAFGAFIIVAVLTLLTRKKT